jgi:hypothetical protein
MSAAEKRTRIPQILSVGSVAEGPCGSVGCFFELQQIVSRVSGTGARSISRLCGIGRIARPRTALVEQVARQSGTASGPLS